MAKRVIIDSDSDEDVSLLWYKKPRINNSSLKIDSTSSDEENTQPIKKESKEPFGVASNTKTLDLDEKERGRKEIRQSIKVEPQRKPLVVPCVNSIYRQDPTDQPKATACVKNLLQCDENVIKSESSENDVIDNDSDGKANKSSSEEYEIDTSSEKSIFNHVKEDFIKIEEIEESLDSFGANPFIDWEAEDTDDYDEESGLDEEEPSGESIISSNGKSSECLSLKIPEWNENSDHPPREIKAETVKDSTVWDKDTIAKTNSANGWPPMNVSTDLCIQYVKSQDIIDRAQCVERTTPDQYIVREPLRTDAKRHGHENIDAVVSSSVDLEKQSASEEAIECVGEMKREGKVLLMCTRKEAIYDDEAF